ncbi:hypothetical protein SAMN05216456_1457 [Devosia crocina]|uniref:Tyr recombinase domain-containing protein n=1 Tax=Devosia crocina TaxID=429728 RepID=A0A1I7NAU4_9HYPH|nr:hypothetical protein [Devosia crocina]SFV31785.1 hypothetical protein SAMN05216456_1457 [Devosia crocina]
MGIVRPKFDTGFIQEYLDRVEMLAKTPAFFRGEELTAMRAWAVAELAFSSGVVPTRLAGLLSSDRDSVRLAVRIDGRWIPITEKANAAIDTYRSHLAAHRGNPGNFLLSNASDPSIAISPRSLTLGFGWIRERVGIHVAAVDLVNAFTVEMKARGMSARELEYITGIPAHRIEFRRR